MAETRPGTPFGDRPVLAAVIVGKYLTTLGRPIDAGLDLLRELKTPFKAISAAI